jgi:gamma-glutamylcyclotransferase (GGCT)/AIG2-like uncharacterized protein YtfP
MPATGYCRVAMASLLLLCGGCLSSRQTNVNNSLVAKPASESSGETKQHNVAPLSKSDVPSGTGTTDPKESSVPSLSWRERDLRKSEGLKTRFDSSSPDIRHAGAASRSTGSDSKSKEEAIENRKVTEMALDLAGKIKEVRAIKLCRITKDDEWWITLYQDIGHSYDLKQYVWNRYKDKPVPFLVERRIPKDILSQHVEDSGSDKTCKVLEADLRPRHLPETETVRATPEKTEAMPDEHRNSMQKQSATKAAKTLEKQPVVQATQSRRTDVVVASAQREAASRTVARPQMSRMDQDEPDDLMNDSNSVKDIPKKGSNAPIRKASSSLGPEAMKRPRSSDDNDSKHPESSRSRPTCFVFVYGSSMNHSELMDWLKAKGHDPSLIGDAVPAKLKGYDFVWNYFSPSRGGGAVNIEPKANSTIWGLLLEIEDPLLKAFDKKEGHPVDYSREETRMPVTRLEDGQTHFAWVYFARPNRSMRRDIWPTPEYKEKVIDAALFWGLPRDYVDKIRNWPVRSRNE